VVLALSPLVLNWQTNGNATGCRLDEMSNFGRSCYEKSAQLPTDPYAVRHYDDRAQDACPEIQKIVRDLTYALRRMIPAVPS